ncbi:MAG: hypothetical protein LPD71_06440 [Shewanella sp.]|nr:hypothetical protein [Shewanella sp.]MCF1438383.1 hypothetical protein [Shewanella sp.]
MSGKGQEMEFIGFTPFFDGIAGCAEFLAVLILIEMLTCPAALVLAFTMVVAI